MAAQSSAPCPNCGKPLAWIAQYGQWYCYTDQQSFPPAKLVQPASSKPYPPLPRAKGLTGTKLFVIIVAAILAVVLIIGFALVALFAATSGPGPDSSQVTLEILSASWRTEDTYGFSPDPGMRFLWLVVNVHNAWDEPIAIRSLYFTAEGTEGSSYDSKQLLGPDSIASGGSGNVTLVFEVPDSWVPRTLHYELRFGSATTAIPTPGGQVRSIGINLGSAGDNYTLLFTSVPQGLAKDSTFVLIRSPIGAIMCQRTAFPSLNGAATGCTAVWYSPVTSSGVNIQVQDALLVSKTTYLSGSVIEISDANGILARATLS